MFVEEKRTGEAVEVKLEPWRQWCLDAAQYIREHGWCQDREYDAQGRVCMVGALRKTEPKEGDTKHLWKILDRAFNFQILGLNSDKFHASFIYYNFIYYNDRYGRTESQVIDMLKTMAKQGRE